MREKLEASYPFLLRRQLSQELFGLLPGTALCMPTFV